MIPSPDDYTDILIIFQMKSEDQRFDENLAMSGVTLTYWRVSGNLKCDCPADALHSNFTDNC